jgi:hypothetical protein
MSSPPRFPLLTFATFGHPIASLGSLVDIARQVGLPSLDIEAAGRARRTTPHGVTEVVQRAGLRLNAIWLDPGGASRLHQRRNDSLVNWAADLARSSQISAIVADAAIGQGPDQQRRARLAQQLQRVLAPPTRLTIALRPRQLEGGRAHLDRLVALRRQAEEWDFDLALDLCGPIDIAWESEAAISKLWSRLTLVRIGPAESTPPGRGRSWQTQRVLAFLADLGYDQTIAIAAHATPWPFGWSGALARSLDRTAMAVVERFHAVRPEQKIDRIPESKQRF